MTAQTGDEDLGLPGAERCMGAIPLSLGDHSIRLVSLVRRERHEVRTTAVPVLI
jgi:hypothetical protein